MGRASGGDVWTPGNGPGVNLNLVLNFPTCQTLRPLLVLITYDPGPTPRLTSGDWCWLLIIRFPHQVPISLTLIPHFPLATRSLPVLNCVVLLHLKSTDQPATPGPSAGTGKAMPPGQSHWVERVNLRTWGAIQDGVSSPVGGVV